MGLWAIALAGELAYYHPGDVAKKSARFAAVSEKMAPAYEDVQGAVARADAALLDLEYGVALLGDAAPAALATWAADTRKQVKGEMARVQKHADLLGEDYDRVFTAAMERALPAATKGYDVKECGATGVAAMMGRTTCQGKDLNGAIAAAMDQDAALQKELDDIARVEWPTVTLPKKAQGPVALTGTARWVDGGALARQLPGLERLRKASQEEIGAALEDDEDPKRVEKAQKLHAAWLAALGEQGATLRAAAKASLERGAKKGGPAEVGWCGNPRALGGCEGEDATKAVIEALKADKKFWKDVGALGE
ncbi:MAG: hypothetical protein ACOZNI_18630 [Myxococcota bacterium]